MPRGGPGSAEPRKLPAGWPRMAPALVWSWHAGQWWVVGLAKDLATAQASAGLRLLNTLNGTHGNRLLGCKPITPRLGCRFVATDRDGDPQTEWETIHGD
jgi:hypothetical protein